MGYTNIASKNFFYKENFFLRPLEVHQLIFVLFLCPSIFFYSYISDPWTQSKKCCSYFLLQILPWVHRADFSLCGGINRTRQVTKKVNFFCFVRSVALEKQGFLVKSFLQIESSCHELHDNVVVCVSSLFPRR